MHSPVLSLQRVYALPSCTSCIRRVLEATHNYYCERAVVQNADGALCILAGGRVVSNVKKKLKRKRGGNEDFGEKRVEMKRDGEKRRVEKTPPLHSLSGGNPNSQLANSRKTRNNLPCLNIPNRQDLIA